MLNNFEQSMNEHGGNIYRLAEELGLPESKIIDFSASINPLGVSKRVGDKIKKGLKDLSHYPDPDTKELRGKIAQYHDIEPETLLCGNGSTELIYLVPRAFKPEKVLIPSPTFSEYERAVVSSQSPENPGLAPRSGAGRTQIKFLNLEKENGFEIRPDEFITAMAGKSSCVTEIQNSNPPLPPFTKGGINKPCDMAFLCNPNNPTGRLLKKNDVFEIAEAAKKLKCLLIVDEAFIDFHPEESMIKDTHDNPYLIVLRSMTKFYALTGLRVGYGVFPSYLINKLKEFKEPWTVNTLAQKAAMAAIGDNEYIGKTLRLIKSEKDFLENGFRRIGVEFFPSDANFYLLKFNNANEIILSLLKKGILVRDCSNFKGLNGSYIRIAVKSREDNMQLLGELSLWQKA